MKFKSILVVLTFVADFAMANAGGTGHIGGTSYSMNQEDVFGYRTLELTESPAIKFLGRNQGEYVFEVSEPSGETQIFSLRPEEIEPAMLDAILKSQSENGNEVSLVSI